MTKVIYKNGHYEVYKDGKLWCSADTRHEAEQDKEEAEKFDFKKKKKRRIIMNVNDARVIITIDDEEQISLRDFGYISDEDFGDKEAITNAIHDIIADLWKMREH